MSAVRDVPAPLLNVEMRKYFNKIMFLAKLLMIMELTKKIPTEDFSSVLVQ